MELQASPAEEAPEIAVARPGAARRRRARVVGIIGGTTLVLGLAGGGVAAAATKSTAKPHSTAKGGPGPMAPGMGGGPGGLVTALGSDSITVTGMDGTSQTITTTSSTTYTKDGASATSAALAVGDDVSFVLTAPPSSSSTAETAKSVNVMSPSLQGTVVSATGTTIVLEDNQGFHRTVDTSGSTTFLYGGESSTISSVTAGESVTALGSVDADHTDLDATTVDVNLPRVTGAVKALSGDTFTLTEQSGTTVTVTESSSTVYNSASMTSATSAEVVAGASVSVEGTADSSGNITATAISLLPASGAKAPTRAGGGGPGGPGGGPGGGGPGGGPGGGGPGGPGGGF